MIKALKIFRTIWLIIALLLFLMSIIGMFLAAENFFAGIAEIQRVFSPFNIINTIVMIITLSPALIAIYFINKLENKQNHKKEEANE